MDIRQRHPRKASAVSVPKRQSVKVSDMTGRPVGQVGSYLDRAAVLAEGAAVAYRAPRLPLLHCRLRTQLAG